MEFCQNNDLQLIIRAHECVMDGFERFAGGHLITLFSATNYCGAWCWCILVFVHCVRACSADLHSVHTFATSLSCVLGCMGLSYVPFVMPGAIL